MAKLNSIEEINVNLASHGYSIYLGADLLSQNDLLSQHVLSEKVFIVTNDVVGPLYLETVQNSLSEKQVDYLLIPDGETFKNQNSLSMIYDRLMEGGHHRDTTLIALGGGVVGDITGFAASTYQRGVRFLQMPTTLLAQVDAAIGGKTAINHPKGKNMIGSFYQPSAVFISYNTLLSLPEREFRAGLGEVIKYALLVGGHLLQLLCDTIHFLTKTSPNLPFIIRECCKIKAKIVQEDERDETGQRALLNLGHTFAHGLESLTHYERFLHGEAVGIGLYCAALLSYQLGYLKKSELELIDFLLESAKLPRRIPKDLDSVQLSNLMMGDKKVQGGRLRFVLLRHIGDCFLDGNVSPHELEKLLLTATEGEKT